MTIQADDLETVLPQLREWLAGEDLVEDDAIVLLAGSLASGLGNSASDIDLYVVRRGARGELEGQQFFALGRRVDCHDVSLGELVEETARLARDLDEGAVPTAGALTYLYRVCHGVPIAGGGLDAAWVERCRRLVAGGVVAAGADLVRKAWTRLECAAELRSFPDHELACRAWEEAVMFAVLAAEGSDYPNQKWNWEKLARVPDTRAAAIARESAGLLRSAWPDLPDPVTLVELLGKSGVPVSLRRLGVRVGPVGNVGILDLGEDSYVVAGAIVYRVSGAVVEVLGLLTRPRTFAELVDDLHEIHRGARRRVEEALRILVEELLAAAVVELLPGEDELPPDGVTPPPVIRAEIDALDALVVPEGGAAEWVRRQYAVWLAWVEYLSHGDDLTGAVSAGQHGAAAAAARALATDLMTLRAASRGHYGVPTSPRGQALLRADLGQESRIFRELMGLATLGGDPDVPDLVERVRALEAELVGHLRFAIGGDLVTDDGHRQLFSYARQLLEAADVLGVELGNPAWVKEKADRYGADGSGSQNSTDPADRVDNDRREAPA